MTDLSILEQCLLTCDAPETVWRPAGFTRKAIAGANASVGTPGISAHRLRGTFATLHSEAGTPIQTIQNMLGHKSASTTMLYLEAHREKAETQQAEVARMMGLAQ